MIFRTLLVLACIRCSLSSPVGATPAAVPATEKYTKDGLADEFKGLYWDYAFQKDENGNQECTKKMLDVLVPALRKTKEFTGLLTKSDRRDYNNDGAWHTFYIRPNPDSKKIVDQDWKFNDGNKGALKAINDNARIAATYPYTGGSGSKAQRASIRCKEALPDGSKFCPSRPLLPAYTTQPGGRGGTGDNTWITFCPKFFADKDIPNLDDLTQKKKRSSELFSLRSREHIM